MNEETIKDCCDCKYYWQNSDTENECQGQSEICHEFVYFKDPRSIEGISIV